MGRNAFIPYGYQGNRVANNSFALPEPDLPAPGSDRGSQIFGGSFNQPERPDPPYVPYASNWNTGLYNNTSNNDSTQAPTTMGQNPYGGSPSGVQSPSTFTSPYGNEGSGTPNYGQLGSAPQGHWYDGLLNGLLRAGTYGILGNHKNNTVIGTDPNNGEPVYSAPLVNGPQISNSALDAYDRAMSTPIDPSTGMRYNVYPGGAGNPTVNDPSIGQPIPDSGNWRYGGNNAPQGSIIGSVNGEPLYKGTDVTGRSGGTASGSGANYGSYGGFGGFNNTGFAGSFPSAVSNFAQAQAYYGGGGGTGSGGSYAPGMGYPVYRVY